jgi:hypothetical protein
VCDENEIVDETNFCSGWEWFACDEEGKVGYFHNGGLRHLPKTVKSDRRATERLAIYFVEELNDRCGYSLRQGVEEDFGGWKRIINREEFLKTYAEVARKGIFTHKTQHIYGAEAAEAARQLGVFSEETKHIYDLEGSAGYYLVAIPKCPLHLSDLPREIAETISRVRSPFPFGATTHFAEVQTMKW